MRIDRLIILLLLLVLLSARLIQGFFSPSISQLFVEDRYWIDVGASGLRAEFINRQAHTCKKLTAKNSKQDKLVRAQDGNDDDDAARPKRKFSRDSSLEELEEAAEDVHERCVSTDISFD